MKTKYGYIWQDASTNYQKYERLPKNRLRMFEAFNPYGRLPKLFHPSTGGQNLSWLAIDLLILSFANNLDYELLENEEFIKESLSYCQEDLACTPQLMFSEILFPGRVTCKLALFVCKKLHADEFFMKHFFPMLRRELKISFFDRNRFKDLGLAPLEKKMTYMFIKNYNHAPRKRNC